MPLNMKLRIMTDVTSQCGRDMKPKKLVIDITI